MLVKPSGQERGLPVEAGVAGVIPDDVIGFLYFNVEVELGGDHAIGGCGVQSAQLPKPPTLSLRGARDDDGSVEVCLGPGLVKERDIDAKPATVAESLLRECDPSGADDGMQYVFESLALQLI